MTGAKQRCLHTREGFSLLEILIVVALFAMASIILAQVFLSFSRLHRKISNQVVLSQDMRFAMELLVREARNKTVQYTDPATGLPITYALGGTVASSSEMHLTGTNDTTDVEVTNDQTICGDVAGINCLALSKDRGTSWYPITSKHVNVQMFGAYVRPTVSPFDQSSGSYPNNIQPMVTLNLSLQYVAQNPQDNTTLQAQTSVSSRIYQR